MLTTFIAGMVSKSPTLSGFSGLMKFISHGHSSSIKTSFESELGPLIFVSGWLIYLKFESISSYTNSTVMCAQLWFDERL
jgi:hypothetical protein